MMVGKTGSGKTTLINSLMNYLYDVPFEAGYRYKLIDEAQTKRKKQTFDSQTDSVTIYYIHPPNFEFGVALIDTPGFGDTRGPEQDQKIIDDMKLFFETQIDSIHAICFVIQAGDSRLCPQQKYVMDRVLSVFAKDISENLFALITFCDAKAPPALEAIKGYSIPIKHHYKLNNSAFFLSDTDNTTEDDIEFNKLSYKMGIKAFDSFFNRLRITQPESLKLTKQVLRERHSLEVSISTLQQQITNGLNMIASLRDLNEQIQAQENTINLNKDFTVKQEIPKCTKVALSPGVHTTNCLVCNFTCHLGCTIPQDEDKNHCIAMDPHGNCRHCPGKCHYTSHSNIPYEFVYTTEIQTITNKELEKRYFDATSEKSKFQQMIDGTLKEYENIATSVRKLIIEIRQCINRLHEIALKPNILNESEYYDLLIQSEKDQKNPGWQRRINALKNLQKQNAHLKEINNENYDPFQFDHSQVSHQIKTG